MGEQRQIRSRSWNRMPTKRCSANGVTNEFIVVDDDEVIILDFPESSKSKAENEFMLQRVISIDDDDDEDTENVNKDGSSSTRAANLKTSAEVDNDDCQFIQEKSANFRFSKCKQASSTMPSSGIRFGLGSESESEFSDSDCSDCEIFDGSNGEVRKQWEKAFSEKMKKAGKALTEEAGPSNLHRDTNFGPGFESKQHGQTSSFFTARNLDGGKETSSFSFGTGSRNPNTYPFGSEMKKNCTDSKFFSKPDFPGPSSMPPNVQVEGSDSLPTYFTRSKKPIHQCETSQLPKEKKMKKAPKEKQMKKAPKENQKEKAADQSHTKEVVKEEEDASKSIPSTNELAQGLHGTAPAMDIMLNREMLKVTDEYKKAQEEEWESRQRQLQQQAEEAQRQRKRIKLANTRQSEMERRQKERVEEVRETQKKGEESMNMKEKVRAEITKSLKLLELKSFNMASLLRGLGIPVAGGATPLPDEVHAAYKRAVLKFHPDRASRLDIKQQVEAEEKFKLIARMKDKLLS